MNQTSLTEERGLDMAVVCWGGGGGVPPPPPHNTYTGMCCPWGLWFWIPDLEPGFHFRDDNKHIFTVPWHFFVSGFHWISVWIDLSYMVVFFLQDMKTMKLYCVNHDDLIRRIGELII